MSEILSRSGVDTAFSSRYLKNTEASQLAPAAITPPTVEGIARGFDGIPQEVKTIAIEQADRFAHKSDAEVKQDFAALYADQPMDVKMAAYDAYADFRRNTCDSLFAELNGRYVAEGQPKKDAKKQATREAVVGAQNAAMTKMAIEVAIAEARHTYPINPGKERSVNEWGYNQADELIAQAITAVRPHTA